MTLDTNMTIDDLLMWHPQAASVFIRRMMLCVGCPAARFHTLADASQLFGYELEDLSGEINIAISVPTSRSGSVQMSAVRGEEQGVGQ
jgi:hybrid cluster-associated redox disulfide protein